MSQKLLIVPYTEAQARELVRKFVRYGKGVESWPWHDFPDADIEKIAAEHGLDISKMVAALTANHNIGVSRFENIVSMGTITFSSSGTNDMKVTSRIGGVVVSGIDIPGGNGVMRNAHIADFEAACQARDATISENSFDHFNTMLAKGVSALEAYMNLRVELYNKTCAPGDVLEEKRPKGGFVSFDEKIINWIPKMTGNNFDRTSTAWQNFRILKELRNNLVVHPKPDRGLSTLAQLADGINRFRDGIAQLKAKLQILFWDELDATLIRATCFPEVQVVDVAES